MCDLNVTYDFFFWRGGATVKNACQLSHQWMIGMEHGTVAGVPECGDTVYPNPDLRQTHLKGFNRFPGGDDIINDDDVLVLELFTQIGIEHYHAGGRLHLGDVAFLSLRFNCGLCFGVFILRQYLASEIFSQPIREEFWD